MISTRSIRFVAAMACVAFASAQCSSARPSGPTTASGVPRGSTAASHGASSSPDLSAVVAPASLAFVARVAPLRGLLDRVGTMTGIGTMLTTQADLLLRMWNSDLVSLIDRESPIDVLFSFPTPQDVKVAIAFGAGSMQDIEEQLGTTYRMVPGVDGTATLERSGSDARESTGPEQCVVGPTPRTGVTRVVCAETMAVAQAMLPYASRTLTRTEVPAYSITFEVLMDAMRRLWLNDALASLPRDPRTWIEQQNSSSPTRLSPATILALLPVAAEAMTLLRSGALDTTRAGMRLEFGEDRIALRMEGETRNPSSSILRAYVHALGDRTAPDAAWLRRFLPGGYMHCSVSGDSTELRPFLVQVRDLLGALLSESTALDDTDRATLRTALDLAIRVGVATTTFSIGADDHGRSWAAGTARQSGITPAEEIAAIRAVVGVLARPHVQARLRELAAEFNHPATDVVVRELHPRGLPSGAVLVEIPDTTLWLDRPAPASSSAPRGRRARAPQRPRLQFMMVAEGDAETFAWGVDARAVLQRWTSNTTPAIDPALVTAPPAGGSCGMVLAGVPNVLRSHHASEAQEMERWLQRLPDQGGTPILYRTGSESAGDAQRVFVDLEMLRASIRALVHGAMSGSATVPPPAPRP